MSRQSTNLIRLHRVDGGEYLLDSSSLTRHCVVFGATGSGKTMLSKSIVEAAALGGVPVLAIDPKGDIGSLAIHPHAARSTIELQRVGHGESGPDSVDVDRFDRNVEVRIFTPRSGAGIPVSLSPRLQAPPNFGSLLSEDPPLAYEMLEITSSTIGKLVGFNEEDKVKLAFIAAILEHYWTHGSPVDIQDLVTAVRNPPFEKFGELKVDDVFERKEKAELITRMNLLLTDPGIKSWFLGHPVDFDRWFTVKEKVPVNVVDLRGVAGEAERQVFVEYLLEQLFFWMMRQRGSQTLKYLLYFDEIHGFCPPVRAPPSKKILIRLVKMARAFGLGMVLATQNPSDLDYKVLSNANIRFIGNLPMRQDIERVRLGLDLGAEAMDILSSLKKLEFYCQIFDKNQGFLTVPGQLISQHGGPLELNDVKKLMNPLREEWVPGGKLLSDAEMSPSRKRDTARELRIVPDSLAVNVDLDKCSKPPLHGPMSLTELKLRFDPYYVLDYEVNTWKQFPHYQKEVRINGKGTLVVNAIDGIVETVIPNDEGSSHFPPGRRKPSDSIAKTLVAGEPITVEVPSHGYLTATALSKVKDQAQVELRAKQYISDSYDKQVKLVGVRTSRVVTVKPTARDIRFENVKLLQHPVLSTTFNIDGTKEIFKRVLSASNNAVLETRYPVCSKGLHEIRSGSVTATICGHACCPEHQHGCPICSCVYCSACRPVLSCEHVACTEHTAKCILGPEEICMKCGLNSCEHYTCSSHRRECENCGKPICLNCVVEKGVLRKRYACSKSCAVLL